MNRRTDATRPRATDVFRRLGDRARRFDRHVVAGDAQRSAASIVAAAAIVLIPLFSAWQVAKTAAGEAAPLTIAMSTDPPPREPVFSVRRVARTAAIEARVASVRGRLARFAPSLPEQSCLVARADGRTLADVRGTTGFVPASNQKLLVAAAALDVLGADHRFETLLVGGRAGNAIVGDLFLVGGGDPLLSTRAYPPTQRYATLAPTYLDALADEIAAAGIVTVSGSVVGDESRYDTERYVPSWGAGIRAVEAGPLSALMVDDGVLVGEPLKPANPAVGAATVFTRLLQARGVSVRGAPRAGSAPANSTVIARLASAPLSTILTDLLTNSDNNAAELLLKELGLARSGTPTRVAGLQVAADVLAARDIPVDGLVLADGSGLDDTNRVSCATLAALLDSYGFDSPLGAGLALAGTTGTLTDILTTGPASGRVRAKTGTLRSVKSLSGFFPVRDGSITFALILNGPGISDQSAYRPLWNELMESLATYRASPQTAQLLPR
jgi:D-alanyl-D-alanine carboxypeptidase/D-alanyl-D-alanine-endopeptidase (penicillin-binding protein 4)